MSDIERAEYEELARKDKERFDRESEVSFCMMWDYSLRQGTRKCYAYKKNVVVKML